MSGVIFRVAPSNRLRIGISVVRSMPDWIFGSSRRPVRPCSGVKMTATFTLPDRRRTSMLRRPSDVRPLWLVIIPMRLPASGAKSSSTKTSKPVFTCAASAGKDKKSKRAAVRARLAGRLRFRLDDFFISSLLSPARCLEPRFAAGVVPPGSLADQDARSREPVRFDQRPDGRVVPGRNDAISPARAHQSDEFRAEHLTAEYAADVSKGRGFLALEESRPNHIRNGREISGGVLQNRAGHRILQSRRFLHERGQRGDPFASEFGAVEFPLHEANVVQSDSLAQHSPQHRGRPPTLFESQRSAERLAGEIEGAAFVAEQVTPTSGPRRFSRLIPSEADGPGAGDGHNAGFAAERTGQRNHGIVTQPDLSGVNQFLYDRPLAGVSSGEAEKGRFERGIGKIAPELPARPPRGFLQGAKHAFPALRSADMLDGSPLTCGEDAR